MADRKAARRARRLAGLSALFAIALGTQAQAQCDVDELTAASVAWAELTKPRPVPIPEYPTSAAATRSQAQRWRQLAEDAERRELAEARWRKAVRDCGNSK